MTRTFTCNIHNQQLEKLLIVANKERETHTWHLNPNPNVDHHPVYQN